MGGGNGFGKGKGFSGACIKDTWTKSKEDRSKGGKWEWPGGGIVGEGNGDNCT